MDGKYCTNPTTKLSYMKTDYGKNKNFYTSAFPSYYCGKNCDLDGRNCKVGFCNVKDCAPGYQLKGIYCLNPAISIAYDREKKYYVYLIEQQWVGKKEIFAQCGQYCDFQGKNCQIGNCNTTGKKAANALKNFKGRVTDIFGIGVIIPAAGIYYLLGGK